VSYGAAEKPAALKEVAPVARGRIRVQTCVEEYTTALAGRFARDAEKVGVDGLLVLLVM
jgi:dihydrodipicolinate synthase/N-acetylneuraminate lyase